MKTDLGTKNRLWKNMQCAIPFEVAEILGVRPGEYIQFVQNGDRVEVEKR